LAGSCGNAKASMTVENADEYAEELADYAYNTIWKI
jgi:hypothetical protein